MRLYTNPCFQLVASLTKTDDSTVSGYKAKYLDEALRTYPFFQIEILFYKFQSQMTHFIALERQLSGYKYLLLLQKAWV